ncbi:MAG: PAS domain-containing protein [Chloroflexi bacterium]|nr:MAG: PAS domain-containing protein [Chloroflexota bacterium]
MRSSHKMIECIYMEPGQAVQLEYICAHITIGLVILDATNLRIRYANPYLCSLLDEPWSYRGVIGRSVEEVLSAKISALALPHLQHVAMTGERIQRAEVPYEGFLTSRGRTYWCISVERLPAEQETSPTLLVTVEDITETVRSRLQLNAIHHISAVIAGPSALPQVLERILQALHELVGATRCAIVLADQTSTESRALNDDEAQPESSKPVVRSARIAAQRGIHTTSLDWHPVINEHILLGRAETAGRALIISDTSTVRDIELPNVDNDGVVWRPGAVLCVPIFEPYPTQHTTRPESDSIVQHVANIRSGSVLGTIEVYHRRPRGFPAEEVRLLERFAQQVGLAIHNASLFRSVDRWARTASRNAYQKENVMRAIPDGVVIYDTRWHVADANPAACKLFGWSDEVMGKSIVDAIARGSSTFQADFLRLPNVVAELERRAQTGQIDEFKLTDANGHTYTLSCSYTPIHDDEGDIFAFITTYHDITEEVAARERVEAEVIARRAELAQRNEALQETKATQELTSARMELLLERLPSGVILVMAQDSNISVVNRRAVQLLQCLGLPLEPLDDLYEAGRRAIGMNCEQMLRRLTFYGTSGSQVSYEEGPLFRALNKGDASEAELHAVTADGQTLHLLVNAAPLRAADRTITNAVLVMHNITKTKALERAREDFFTTMAHELKTPLGNIKVHLSALLARDLQWSVEEQYDFLQTADEQVERLVRMINHFLDASRVEAGALRLELEPIFLPELLEDLQDRLEALISTSGRSFVISLPAQLPAVLGDYELIMSVLTNLLSNAFRYAPEGDAVYLDAELVFTQNDTISTGVKMSVRDRGPGMTRELQKELFTRFSTFAAMHRPAVDRPGQPLGGRRRNTARWSPATGLGLYISRGIMEAHGSTLTVKSSPGQGATFSFILPIYAGKR